jgi:hypothetical protein
MSFLRLAMLALVLLSSMSLALAPALGAAKAPRERLLMDRGWHFALGDACSPEPDQASQRKAFNGLCMVIVQAGREVDSIRLTATSPGLEPASATIEARPARREW